MATESEKEILRKEICVVSLCYNEIELLPMFYRWIKQFASSWIVLDHGSNDGSIEFLWRMKDRKEMDITVSVQPSDNFFGSFWGEQNKVIAMANRNWTFKLAPDELPTPDIFKVVDVIINQKVLIWLWRIQLCNLYPLKERNSAWYPLLFPTEWKIQLINSGGVHQAEIPKPDSPSIYWEKSHVWHIGECRNFLKVREKEVSYEKLGQTEMTSKWNADNKAQYISESKDYTDTRIYELLI